jgi:5-methyltetrahydrofolate--homocysteine methyltransferase
MTKNQFLKLINNKLVILDGATGTELVKNGMPNGVCPEKWAIENKDVIIDIQKSYIKSGSDIIYTPTFGGNRCKLAEFGLEKDVYNINKKLGGYSKIAAGEKYAFGDLAPTGKFIEPFGDLLFEDAVDIYKEQVKALLDGGVDGFVIETMMDIQEARAALIAVTESSDLPVMVSMTFNKDGTTLNGTDSLSALITLQALGADAVGCNCSTGPSDMIKIIKKIKPYATVPLLAKPNAGMPSLLNGKTVFNMDSVEFGSYTDEFIKAGINILGGCCGTSFDYIKAISDISINKKTIGPKVKSISAVSSSRKFYHLEKDKNLSIIGERINPTGKKALQEELRNNKFSIVQQYAIEQKNNGANILDVNMGLSGINEIQMMVESIKLLSKISDIPLCIDSTDPSVIEAALRIYPGRALVNSISAEKERIEKTIPIVAKYGAMFILLPLTDAGIPANIDERKKVIKYIINEAKKNKFELNDIVIDGLVMTISSDQKSAGLTLDQIEWCSKELGVNTVCGLSNVSFGLPQRNWINTAFLALAIDRGLSTAILNPSSEITLNISFASDALLMRDEKLKKYINRFTYNKTTFDDNKNQQVDPEMELFNCILNGNEEKIDAIIHKLLNKNVDHQKIIDSILIPAINKVGEKFDKKEFFLPQLIMSADTMKKGFEILEPYLKKDKCENEEKRPVVLIATVQGDIHDIGKNIVALMLKNYNFNIIDLGKDVKASTIINAAKKHNASIIGLSALMTTTMVEMKNVIDLAKKEGLEDIKFMIGGAVVDQNYSDEIGANGYAKDALDAVRLVQKLIDRQE